MGERQGDPTMGTKNSLAITAVAFQAVGVSGVTLSVIKINRKKKKKKDLTMLCSTMRPSELNVKTLIPFLTDCVLLSSSYLWTNFNYVCIPRSFTTLLY